VLTQFAPAFHGLYRALISTSFPWEPAEWIQLAECLNPLFASDTIERLNRLLVDILQRDGVDAEKLQLIQNLLSRYVSHGRPLTGYFIVCCVTEIQWTVLAQSIIKPEVPSREKYLELDEAEAANRAWLSLLRGAMPTNESEVNPAFQGALANGVRMGMMSFTELLSQIEDMDSEPAADTYAWETMSESLVRVAEKTNWRDSFFLSTETSRCLLRSFAENRRGPTESPKSSFEPGIAGLGYPCPRGGAQIYYRLSA
jgi:phosphatidylinositol 4-kinase